MASESTQIFSNKQKNWFKLLLIENETEHKQIWLKSFPFPPQKKPTNPEQQQQQQPANS